MMRTLQKSANSVLILEDDPELADSIRLFLEDTYRVYTINDPSQLKLYINKYGIKLLVTDLDMSYPNLENNLQLIKSSNPGMKIILMYMFLDDEKQKNHSILKEADDYIFKPFDADVFRYKIDRLLA